MSPAALVCAALFRISNFETARFARRRAISVFAGLCGSAAVAIGDERVFQP
jgi:hypothetical protein